MVEVLASNFLWQWWVQLIKPFAQQEGAVQAEGLVHQLIDILERAPQMVGLLTQSKVDFQEKAAHMKGLV